MKYEFGNAGYPYLFRSSTHPPLWDLKRFP
ncbi:hypothetical protein DSM03_10465 [Leeuwenhoekiella aestuarii]|uniref:Uncharacterized protein n=1 Tax=Leeuwenhoekiella aestuarii TaxID=2249426 RepID=A0A4Q0NRU9_9FLAO|nr:hypothetical protein DSM04_105340 [Leeuwenhoekiella aestuarii]RXG14909.1 hypothetical protein DSM03_10465 [Leeuwenhoekiella aestuarii]